MKTTTRTSDGKLRTKHAEPVGEHLAYLEKTDDTTSWGPGHADWVCEKCGRRARMDIDVLRRQPCEREVQDG